MLDGNFSRQEAEKDYILSVSSVLLYHGYHPWHGIVQTQHERVIRKGENVRTPLAILAKPVTYDKGNVALSPAPKGQPPKTRHNPAE